MKDYKFWLKILALVAYAIATIITCSAVWNSAPGPFISVVAIVLLVVDGFIAYKAVQGLKEKTEE